MQHFADRIGDVVRGKGTPLCVGLDPRVESLPLVLRDRHSDPAAACEEFCLRVLDVVAPWVGVVKPQSAFFEVLGSSGFGVLRSVMRRARELGLVTILDAKRGDIATTAAAYAEAAYEYFGADAVTINPYLGRDSIEPFLQSARVRGGGVFILVRTSNAGAGQFQDLPCEGKPLYQHVAAAVRCWAEENLSAAGYGDVGAVVGATRPAELRELRRMLPTCWLLVPGYGAQGGTADDVAGAFRDEGMGALVNSSRGVVFPFPPEERCWEEKIEAATRRAAEELRRAAMGG